MEQSKILIYQTDDGRTQIDVRLENDTVWLTQTQMADLFKSSRTNIIEHIQNIYKDGELNEKSTCRKIRQVRQEGKRTVNREITMFNLDMIISVGYKVNSKRGVRFRQWANEILKQYLIKGYAVNERMRREQIAELRQLVGMLGRTIQNQPLISTDETNALFEVVTDYTYALDTLDNYDYQRCVSLKRVTQIVFYSVPFFSGKNTGITITIAITENSMPLITPTAKLYQNMFCLPSKRNGIKPRTVLRIVSMVGMILRL